jgi:hypothetical protein
VGSSSAAAAAEAAAGVTARRRRRRQQRNGGVGSASAAVAGPLQSVGVSMAAAAGARRQWRRQSQQSGGVQLGGGGGSLTSARRWWRRHNRQSTKSVGGNGIGNGDDYSNNAEQWRANAIVRIIVVAIEQRALEIGKTTALVRQRVLFDDRHSIIVHKAVAQNHEGTHRTIVLEVKILSIDKRRQTTGKPTGNTSRGRTICGRAGWRRGNGIHFGRWGESEYWQRC